MPSELTPDQILEAVSIASQRMLHLRSLTRRQSLLCGDHWPSPLLDRQTVTDISCALLATRGDQTLRKLFWVCCKMRTQEWYPPSSSLCPRLICLPQPSLQSPLSLNIPRPPTLNFPNLKSISVWKSTINFTLTCWTGGKKKITFNLKIAWQKHLKICHLEGWRWALIGRRCCYVSPYSSREPGFYWTISGTGYMNRNKSQ